MLGNYYSKKSGGYGNTAVQSYMERRLTDLHYASADSVKSIKDKVYIFFLGALLVILLPYLHLGVFYLMIWVPDKPEIDRNGCTCSCFDTVFRGRYENPGQTPYKHMYFNSTAQTMKVWVFTVLFVLMAYESVKYLVPLFRRGHIRWSMFFLYLCNLYPHYYSWWSFFNYYNEEFYNYYFHHMFFTITEIIASCMVLNLCDSRNEINPWKILLIVSINLVHVVVAGTDQFFSHVLLGFGRNFQSARDVGLMIPDALHVFIPVHELIQLAKRKEVPLSQLCSIEEIGVLILLVTLGVLFGRLV